MAFGVENGGGSGTPAGRPLPYLKHALPARQENVQSLHAFWNSACSILFIGKRLTK